MTGPEIAVRTGNPQEIVVRRCVVRVVRYGGWSWGPAPRRLVDQVLRELPRLVADRLVEAGVDVRADSSDLDRELTEPVRIRISVSLDALRAGPDDGSIGLDPQRTPSPTAPEARERPDDGRLAIVLDEPQRRVRATPAEALLALLVALHRRGELTALVALLPKSTRVAWWSTLTSAELTDPGFGGGARSATEHARAALRAALNSTVAPDDETGVRDPTPSETPTAAPEARVAWRAALDSTVLFGDRLQGAPDTEAGTRNLSRWASSTAPPGAPEAGADRDPPDHGAPPAPVSGPCKLPGSPVGDPTSATGASPMPRLAPDWDQLPERRPAVGRANPTAQEATVDNAFALPFLLLNPLSRVGYLEALEPALAVTEPQPARRAGLLAAFATALARTVLHPPGRGWRRDPDDIATTRAFTVGDVPEPHLVDLARAAGPALPTLDAVVASALARGHSPDGPLLLVGASRQAGGGMLLADPDGLFPLAWADDVPALLPPWRAAGAPTVLVRAAGLRAEVPCALDAAGVPFVSDAPLARHEHWRRLPTGQWLWTNEFAEAASRLDELVQALAVLRHAVPLAPELALRRSLLLAITVGLGTIASTLWRTRERTDPLLALERFGDLSARVTTDARTLLVRLPMGRRHADLLAGGLLGDVPDVPWLGERTLRITAG